MQILLHLLFFPRSKNAVVIWLPPDQQNKPPTLTIVYFPAFVSLVSLVQSAVIKNRTCHTQDESFPTPSVSLCKEQQHSSLGSIWHGAPAYFSGIHQGRSCDNPTVTSFDKTKRHHYSSSVRRSVWGIWAQRGNKAAGAAAAERLACLDQSRCQGLLITTTIINVTSVIGTEIKWKTEIPQRLWGIRTHNTLARPNDQMRHFICRDV